MPRQYIYVIIYVSLQLSIPLAPRFHSLKDHAALSHVVPKQCATSGRPKIFLEKLYLNRHRTSVTLP